MRGILLVSHGNLADGMLSSLEMLCGEQKDIFALGLQHSDSVESFTARLLELESVLAQYSEVLVLADLIGGSPCKAALFAFSERKNYHIIGGVNLGLLMEAVDGDVGVDELVDVGRFAIRQVSTEALAADIGELDE